MAVLQIGRVGLDVELATPRTFRVNSRPGNRVVTIAGELASTTLAETLALQTELDNQVGQVVPLIFSHNPVWDGFYVQSDADIDASDYAFNDGGLLDFSVQLVRIGGLSQTEFQSLLTGNLLANVHGLIDSEVRYTHAPAVGALGLDHGSTSPTAHSRVTADGIIQVILGMDNTVDPKWRVAPADYYKGGCALTVDGRVRTGLDVPHDVPDWMLSNGLIRVTPGVTSEVSNGRVEIACFDGTVWDTAKAFRFIFEPSTTNDTLDLWHFMTVEHYTPEKTVIKLIRDAEEAPASTHRYELDIHMRRGFPFVAWHMKWTGAATQFKIAPNTNEAATAVTPTGALAAAGISATANDASGNRYMMATPLAHTADTVNGGLTFASVREFWGLLGYEINGSAAAANDLAGPLILQGFARLEEEQRAVRG